LNVAVGTAAKVQRCPSSAAVDGDGGAGASGVDDDEDGAAAGASGVDDDEDGAAAGAVSAAGAAAARATATHHPNALTGPR